MLARLTLLYASVSLGLTQTGTETMSRSLNITNNENENISYSIMTTDPQITANDYSGTVSPSDRVEILINLPPE